MFKRRNPYIKLFLLLLVCLLAPGVAVKAVAVAEDAPVSVTEGNAVKIPFEDVSTNLSEMLYNIENTNGTSGFTYYEPGEKYVITKDNILVRTGPQEEAAIITMIPANTIISVLSTNKIKWACVNYNGTIGWTKSGFLKNYNQNKMEKVVLNVPYISQVSPVYAPVGCEGAAALMGLKYQGYAKDVDLRKFLDNMPKHTSNPAKGFVGSPYIPDRKKRTTIYPAKLTEYCSLYGSSADLSGASPEDLRREIQNGNPVVIYATLYWEKPRYGKYNIEGEIQSLLRNNHAVTITGYDPATNNYFIADPYNKKNSKQSYFYWKDGTTVEQIFNERKWAISFRKNNQVAVTQVVLLNGQVITQPLSVININSSNMVSIVDFASLIGAETERNTSLNHTIKYKDKTIQFNYNDNEYLVNQKPKEIEITVMSIEGEMFIPLSIVIREFGLFVDYN